MSTENTVDFGGKPYPEWTRHSIELPGYVNATLQFVNTVTNEVVNCGFMVGPSNFADSRSNLQQINRTNAGWFIMRIGKKSSNNKFNRIYA